MSSVAFSPDGKRLISGSDATDVKMWDAETGRETLLLKAHGGLVLSVAFSPDGKCVATASQDNTVKLWEIRGGGEARAITGLRERKDQHRAHSGCADVYGSVNLTVFSLSVAIGVEGEGFLLHWLQAPGLRIRSIQMKERAFTVLYLYAQTLAKDTTNPFLDSYQSNSHRL